ncbi:hypothetical protein HPB47_004068 [Ixodes persulcatus]|uniref:Uncharacterized protein n=1 Tax=Ixodes persulcatus TaxID=34615 RepID=A0AC60PGV7_IXOPE|nr:hypothetical protein HPB47_004068 [Ixodes persulcatus]
MWLTESELREKTRTGARGEIKKRSSVRSLEEGFHGYNISWLLVTRRPPKTDSNLDTTANSSADQHPRPHFRVMNRADGSHAYDQLKAAILLRKSESTTSRLQRLLTTEELGDQRPSQLLHRMRQLLGEQASDVNNSILRELLLQRLPQGIRMVLAPANDTSLDRLAEMADRVAEYAVPMVAEFTEPQSSTTATQELQAKVDQLTATVADYVSAIAMWLTVSELREKARTGARGKRKMKKLHQIARGRLPRLHHQQAVGWDSLYTTPVGPNSVQRVHALFGLPMQ